MAEDAKLPDDKQQGTNQANQESFPKAIKTFINEVSAIRVTLDEAMKGSMSGFKATSEGFETFLAQNATEVEKDDEKKVTTFKVSSVNLHKLSESMDRLQVSSLAPAILANAMFVSLVFRWDAYFIKLLRLIYANKSELIDSSTRSITFSELATLGSIEEARHHIMDAEIESVMRESHTKQFERIIKYLNKKDGEKTFKDLKEWSAFIELTERRNLIVHSDGKISRQYLEVCKANKVDVSRDEVGKNITVKQSYMHECCDFLTSFAVKVGHYLWRKFIRDQKKEQDEEFIRITYALIRDQRYHIGEELLADFLDDPRNRERESTRKTCYINLAQSYKWSGKPEKCIQILSREDWSSSRDNFLLALRVLREEYEEASSMMIRIGKDGDVKRHDYDEWPLFKDFRETEAYRRAYSNLFGESTTTTDIQQVEPPQIDNTENDGETVDRSPTFH